MMSAMMKSCPATVRVCLKSCSSRRKEAHDCRTGYGVPSENEPPHAGCYGLVAVLRLALRSVLLLLSLTCCLAGMAANEVPPATASAPAGQATLPEHPSVMTADELLRQPRLITADGKALADAWKLWQPEWTPARVSMKPTSAGLLIDASKADFAVGGVVQTVAGIHGGSAYAVSAQCELSSVPQPYQAVLVRIEWLKDGRALHPAGVLARGPHLQGNKARFDDVFIAPAEADGARVSLEAKWLRGGSILWKEASLLPTSPPPPRKVKVGTVYLRPRISTPARNLDLWCEQIDAAGKLGLDIVCLSEAILQVGTQAKVSELAEPIPGPSTQRLGKAARANHLWVVAGLLERDGNQLFNTAVLLDRNGRLAGKYRKVHLPREEWKKGITPGNEYPVFQTDFGTIGIQICYDYFFPETAESLALAGAEIVFAPTWGTTFADQDGRAEGQTIFRVRARDNGIYLVPSVYDGDSLVIDPLGRILASSGGKTGVFWAEIDLSQREPLWWVGHWRSIGPRHRMPQTYGRLTGVPGEVPPPWP